MPAEIALRHESPLSFASDALIVSVAAKNGEADWSGIAAEVLATLGDDVKTFAAGAGFTGKPGKTLVIPTFGKLQARNLVLTGIGIAESRTSEQVRRAYGSAVTAARDAGADHVAIALPGDSAKLAASDAFAAAIEGVRLATYRFLHYRGTARANEPTPRDLAKVTFAGTLPADAEAIADRVVAVTAAVMTARDLVNEPGNALNPKTMEEHSRAVAAEVGLDVTVIDTRMMDKMGMGAIRAVGKGSVHDPRIIHLTYTPDGTSSGRVIGLVGKCITFDTGGYSIKTADGMLTMKIDMAGGAAVLGAMSVLKAIGCKHVVHGVICVAENMISGVAFRPGDILTASNGVTIEVISTDAEGRLVLADGLVYTARQGATEMIDIATLTGAAVVALGEGTTALYSTDDAMADQLIADATEAGENFWHMPLNDDLLDQIRGDLGDIKNSGGRYGGSITAALFLRHFAEGLPWIHLDIAGTASTSKATAYTPKGATGVGVRPLLNYLSR